MISLVLPWPVSINAYWASRVIQVKGKAMSTTYVTAKGVQFQRDVKAAVTAQIGQHKPLDGRLSVAMKFHQPNARACDISNFVKTTEDALTKAEVWIDDSQIDHEVLHRGEIDRKNPRVEVTIGVIREKERTLLT
jgi:crossover junction endodeoxyribonuclease RusA